MKRQQNIVELVTGPGWDQDFRALLGWWSGFGPGRPRGGAEERGGRPDFKVRLKEAKQVGGRPRVRMGPALILVLSQLGHALLHGSPGLELFPVLFAFCKRSFPGGQIYYPSSGRVVLSTEVPRHYRKQLTYTPGSYLCM